MQFIKSLFCWHGVDNRPRFIVISMTSFITFIILNESLSQYKFSAVFALLICTATFLAATRRRLNDAQLHNNWILAPAGSFLITGLIIIFIGHAGSYWLLLIPLLLALLLLTYRSKRQRHYILGYNGPIDLSQFQAIKQSNSRNNQRVEPTMNGNVDVNSLKNENAHCTLADRNTNQASTISNANQSKIDKHDSNDIGEAIRLVLFSKKNSRITITVISLTLLLALLISMIFGNSKTNSLPVEQVNEPQALATAFQHELTLPDNFSLMTAPKSGLVIHWQADVVKNDDVWTLASAIGDKSCASINFNQGQTIRTYRVSTMDSGYYAYFSPLDTKALIKNIAFKNNFSLCGYNFSLKGSQATLGKATFYANLLEY